MLFKILDSIRQKPKSVRDQYALGIAVCCTVLIGGAWTLSLPSRFAPTGVAAVGSASTTAVTSPFAGLIDQFKNQFKGAKAALEALPSATTTVSAATSSALTETEAALNLQISSENRTELQNTATASSSSIPGYGFATTTSATHQTIMIATSSDQATTTE